MGAIYTRQTIVVIEVVIVNTNLKGMKEIMTWDYAKLSREAKDYGGPEKFVDVLEEASKAVGRTEGQEEMFPWLVVSAVGGVILTYITIKGLGWFNKKKDISQREVDTAKTDMISDIKEHDVTHLRQKTTKEGDEETL